MKFDFPNNPANGDTFAPPGGPVWRWNGTVWTQSGVLGDATIVLIGDIPPPTPKHGQLWWESDTGKLFVWYEDGDSGQWVEAYSATVGAPSKLPAYTVTSAPSAVTAKAGAMIYVSNEAGGGVPAFSDGTSWRRVTDRTVIT